MSQTSVYGVCQSACLLSASFAHFRVHGDCGQGTIELYMKCIASASCCDTLMCTAAGRLKAHYLTSCFHSLESRSYFTDSAASFGASDSWSQVPDGALLCTSEPQTYQCRLQNALSYEMQLRQLQPLLLHTAGGRCDTSSPLLSPLLACMVLRPCQQQPCMRAELILEDCEPYFHTP